MPDTIVRIVDYQSTDYNWACRLREKELRLPFGLILTDEDVAGEASQLHFVAFREEIPCGTCVIKPHGQGVYQLRQMAVNPKYRRLGIGRALVQYYERYLDSKECIKIWLHARTAVRKFYERCGYVSVGDVFEHLGISHVYMDKARQVGKVETLSCNPSPPFSSF